jgi:hypothetical protein
MNYRVLVQGYHQLLLLNIQVVVVRTAPPTLYVHIVVIAGRQSKMCLGGGAQTHLGGAIHRPVSR